MQNVDFIKMRQDLLLFSIWQLILVSRTVLSFLRLEIFMVVTI
jgi:hypothetical protein